MDRETGRRLGLEEKEPVELIPEDEQVEPWAWGDKRMPRHIRRQLERYREFLERYHDEHS